MTSLIRATYWVAAAAHMFGMVDARAHNATTRVPRIINAETSGWHLYQPFVSLLSADDGGVYCSGVVIGDRAILTAAHCLTDGVELVARFNDDSPDMVLDTRKYHVNEQFYGDDPSIWNYDTGVITTETKIPKSAGRGRIIDEHPDYDTILYAFGVGDTVEDETEWHKLTGKQAERGFGDFVDWVVGGVEDAIDWVGDVVFGEDDDDVVYDGDYDDGDYDDGDYGDGDYDDGDYDGEYDGEYEYDDFIAGENVVVASDTPRVAVMIFAKDASCMLNDGMDFPGQVCTISGEQNTCNGDSGGPVVTPDGYILGLTSLGSPGCDRSPTGLYESIAVDLTWRGNRDFIKSIAGDDAYKRNDADPVDVEGAPAPAYLGVPDGSLPVKMSVVAFGAVLLLL